MHDVELLASRPGIVHRQPAEEREALGAHLGRTREMPFVAFGGRECVERAGFEERVAAAAGGFDGGLRRGHRRGRRPLRAEPGRGDHELRGDAIVLDVVSERAGAREELVERRPVGRRGELRPEPVPALGGHRHRERGRCVVAGPFGPLARFEIALEAQIAVQDRERAVPGVEKVASRLGIVGRVVGGLPVAELGLRHEAPAVREVREPPREHVRVGEAVAIDRPGQCGPQVVEDALDGRIGRVGRFELLLERARDVDGPGEVAR